MNSRWTPVIATLLLAFLTLGLMASRAYAADDQPSLVRISGKIMGTRLVHRVTAIYPEEARTKGIEGTVALEIIVGAKGSVEQITVLSGNSMLARSAMDAVRQWQYTPTYVKGEAMRVVTRVDISFSLSS